MDNIVALKDMDDILGVKITMDISKERAVTVEYKGKKYKFKECQYGLYYYDTEVDKPISGVTNKYNAPINPYYFWSAVEYNRSYSVINEIQGANNARKVQHIIGNLEFQLQVYY